LSTVFYRTLDIELALTYKGREEFWDNLRKSEAVEIPGIIYADEITKQKQNILNVWYKDKSNHDVSKNKGLTYEINMEYHCCPV